MVADAPILVIVDVRRVADADAAPAVGVEVNSTDVGSIIVRIKQAVGLVRGSRLTRETLFMMSNLREYCQKFRDIKNFAFTLC